MNMSLLTKKDVVQKVAAKSGVAQSVVAQVLEAQAEVVTDALKHADHATVVGLGKLSAGLRSGRKARNPRTGETVDVLPSIAVKFKPASALKDALN